MKTILRAVLVFGTLAVSAGWPAEKTALPKELPAYGTLKPVPAPAVQQIKLDNGLAVWLVPMPGFPKAAFNIAVRGGRAADPKDRPGLSELIAACVTQGTKTRTAKQIAEEMQAAGGDLRADANTDSVSISTSVLSQSADAGLKLLADVVRNAAFADPEVDLAKRNATSSLEGSEAQPGFLARRALYRALFGDHPYAVIAPTRESIAATTPADLKRQYARYFRPDRSLLVAVGDFAPEKATATIRASFGDWTSSGDAGSLETGKPTPSMSKAVVYVPRANSVQTALMLGTIGPQQSEPDFYATRVANAIYGGMFGSHLILNIREDKGYTYSPFAFLSSFRTTGMLATQADVRNPVTGASFNEITYELNRMATTVPDDQELERAKRYLIGSLALRLQSRESIAQSLASLWINSLPPEELGLQSQKVEHVTAKDVEAAGRKYFPAWRMTVVAVGEEQVIKDELSPLGLEFRKSE